MGWTEHVASMGEIMYAYTKLRGIRGLCRRKKRVEANLRETGCEAVEWVQLSHDRDKWQDFVNTVMNLGIS
jgi:hypothetical protein